MCVQLPLQVIVSRKLYVSKGITKAQVSKLHNQQNLLHSNERNVSLYDVSILQTVTQSHVQTNQLAFHNDSTILA